MSKLLVLIEFSLVFKLFDLLRNFLTHSKGTKTWLITHPFFRALPNGHRLQRGIQLLLHLLYQLFCFGL